MALSYTAPTWEDGGGTGISASQLQALSDCMQGLVQGSDKAIHSISFNNGIATITYADGSIENNVPANMKGISSIAKTGTVDLVDIYTITFTDGTTFTYYVTNGRVGRDGAIQYTAGEGIEISDENVISATAQAQVQADWNEADNTKPDYIKNKPTIPDVRNLYELDDSFITEFYSSSNDSIPVHYTQPGHSGSRQITIEDLKAVFGVPLEVSKASVSSLPTTIYNADITADMKCKPGDYYLTNPNAMSGEWTIVTAAGSATISGVINGTTDITLWLTIPR